MATNGSISAASSILIMSIILRSSPEARSSAYHIIMFFMSFGDVIASICVALNTVPMPYDVHDMYPFAGAALGNVGTCTAQGFLMAYGVLLVLASTVTLNLYYVLTFGYGMAEERFKKRIMPVMLVLSLIICVVIPVRAFTMHLISPSPLLGLCTIDPFPFHCNFNKGEQGTNSTTSNMEECIQGDPAIVVRTISWIARIICGGVFAVIVISMIVVTLSVFYRNEEIIYDSQSTKAIMIQALMYIGAYLLTYAWSFIFVAKVPARISDELQPSSNTLGFLMIFFQPLQGFFNAMIFVYQKAHTLRRTNTGLSLLGACRKVILTPSSVPQQVISCIEIATEDINTRRQENTRTRRGQSSVSLRERVLAKIGSGIRRFGSNVQSADNNASSTPGAIGSDGDEDDNNASSLCLSRDMSLRDVLGPDIGSIDEFQSMRGSREDSSSLDSPPMPNEEEDPSCLSIGSNSLNFPTNMMCSVIAEENDEP